MDFSFYLTMSKTYRKSPDGGYRKEGQDKETRKVAKQLRKFKKQKRALKSYAEQS